MDTLRRPASRAFTLLEVLAVLVILGVFAAVLAPRGSDVGQDLTSAIALLKVRVRYAQMRSINNVSVHGVRSNGSSYWMFYDGDITKKLAFPGVNSNTITLPSGMSMTTFTVSFDSRGVPYADAGATSGNELTAASPAASITVGSRAAAVRIIPGTGYIPD